ncbi:MAG: antiterminator LoaP [Clostridiales bacterium]
MKWYAIFVIAGKEDEVQKWIYYNYGKNDIYAVVPKRKLLEKKKGVKKEVVKNLFKGYVLIKTEMNNEKFKKIIKIPFVIDILGTGSYFSEIPKNEVKHILKLVNNDGVIEFSKITIDGNRVFIKSGPLMESEFEIIKIDIRKSRAKIKFNFLNEEKYIDVGVKFLGSKVS